MTLRRKQAGTGKGGNLKGARHEGSAFGEVKPIVPRAKKPTGVHNPPPDQIPGGVLKKRSSQKISRFRSEESGFELSELGAEAYETLLNSVDKIDLSELAEVEERIPGDREKVITVMQNLALGARHREALADVNWTWSHLSVYRTRFPIIAQIYKQVSKLGEEMRQVLRYDEAHKRAVDGVEEPVYSPNGKYLGTKVRYSDALLQMFLKADHPDKFSEKHEVKQTGVVLNMHMGLRKDVKQEPMTQGDLVMESPFVDDKKGEEPPA